MTLTEEEARKRWCPFVRMLSLETRNGTEAGLTPPFNRIAFNESENGISRNPHACQCIASECMAWKWFDTLSDDGSVCHWKPTPHFPRLPTDQPDKGKPLDQRRGFCGLAGSP